MTPRGRAALALGLVVYGVAWVFGSRALYPVAVGLVLAVALAVLWVRLSARPPAVRRHGTDRDVVEGDDIRIDVVVETSSPVAPPTLVAHEGVGRLGAHDVELVRVGRARFMGHYDLWRVPRGRFPFETVRLSIEDPFGLARAELLRPEAHALVVHPRLVDPGRLFTEGGGRLQEGRRLLLRRAAGYELYGVRDHAQGESLRRVHWPSTARRGRLMVKELEDAPRDEVAVLLDGDAAGVAGEPPDSTFDVAVRAAGSILRAHVRRGRRCVLVVNSTPRETQAIASEGDWRRALELLAAAEPTGRLPASTLLGADSGSAARALELVVVTSRLEPALVDRLVERTLSRRGSALVYVEPVGFAGRRPRPVPDLLRLQSLGIPVAVVQRGDDLAAALSAGPVTEAAHG
jgi:uncharacterized protein (DUF58 family)